MAVSHRIYESGEYNVSGEGENRNLDQGVIVEAWGDEPVVLSGELSNYFVPVVVKGTAPIIIEDLTIHGFGGDGVNICGSNLECGNFTVGENTPTRPYSPLAVAEGERVEAVLEQHEIEVYNPSLIELVEYPAGSGQFVIPGYHGDACQMYGLSQGQHVSRADDVLENIIFHNVNVEMSGAMCQGFALTEACKYRNIQIGIESCRIHVDYFYSIIATNIEGGVFGNSENMDVNAPVRVQNPPTKGCPHGTTDLSILIDGQHALDEGSEVFATEATTEANTSYDDFLFLSEEEQSAINEIMGLSE